MKKALTIAVASSLIASLMTPVFLSTPSIIYAQEERSEEISASEASVSSSDESDEDSQSENEAPFDTLVNPDTAETQNFIEAYDAYKEILSSYELQDMMSETANGTSSEDFIKTFQTSVEPNQVDASETESYITYTFATDGQNDTELMVYFINDRLCYVGVASTFFLLDSENLGLITEETINSWLLNEEHATIEEIAAENPRVIGISQMNFSDFPFNMLMIPTGSDREDVFIDFVVFEDNILLNSLPEEPDVAMDQPNLRMMNYTISFIEYLLEDSTQPV